MCRATVGCGAWALCEVMLRAWVGTGMVPRPGARSLAAARLSVWTEGRVRAELGLGAAPRARAAMGTAGRGARGGLPGGRVLRLGAWVGLVRASGLGL
jgi:hypothetical protein